MKKLILRGKLFIFMFCLLQLSAFSQDCACPGDFNADGIVDKIDVDIFELSFGDKCDGCCEDLNGDGVITASDLTQLLSLVGEECNICDCEGDFNGDNIVDGDDINIL